MLWGDKARWRRSRSFLHQTPVSKSLDKKNNIDTEKQKQGRALRNTRVTGELKNMVKQEGARVN
jgi:hypothetical protein